MGTLSNNTILALLLIVGAVALIALVVWIARRDPEPPPKTPEEYLEKRSDA